MGPIQKRLLGTWRSDKKRTLATWRAFADFSPPKKRKVGALFGKVELRYTAKFCFVTLNGETTRNRYDLVAEDTDSVVIRMHNDGYLRSMDPVMREEMEPFMQSSLWHLHVECIRGQQFYWIGLRVMCEWFRKTS